MARAGSDDAISRQNIRLVNNKPLIYYIIKTALQFKNASVVVSTDSDEIKELSLMYGAEVIDRPKRLTNNSTSVKEICFHALKTLEWNNQNFEYCLVLHPKIPLIELETISEFFKSAEKNTGTIFGVSSLINPKYAYKIEYSQKILKLARILHDTALLNKIVCFKTKNFIDNNGKFVTPYRGIKLSKTETRELASYQDFGIFEQILLKRRILVRIDSSILIGMGHVYNMLTILNHFRNDDVIIVMHKNRNLGLKKFKENLYAVKLFSSHSDLKSIIDSFKPDMIFNDILNTKKNFMKTLSMYGCLIVNFEDLGDGRKYANLVFNPIFKEKKHLPNEYYGGKYACVRDEFRLFKNSILRDVPKKVVISYGGTDQRNLTGKTIIAIEKNNLKNIEFIIILGFGFSHKEKIKQKILDLNRLGFRFILVEKSDFLAQYVRDIDFSIISNGRTVFEFACMTVPILAVSVNSREMSHNFIKDEKIGLEFVFNDKTFEDQLIDGINHMLVYGNRKYYKNKLLKLDLLSGVDRVVDIINEEYRRLKSEKTTRD